VEEPCAGLVRRRSGAPGRRMNVSDPDFGLSASRGSEQAVGWNWTTRAHRLRHEVGPRPGRRIARRKAACRLGSRQGETWRAPLRDGFTLPSRILCQDIGRAAAVGRGYAMVGQISSGVNAGALPSRHVVRSAVWAMAAGLCGPVMAAQPNQIKD
jgi:hypothetical protein